MIFTQTEMKFLFPFLLVVFLYRSKQSDMKKWIKIIAVLIILGLVGAVAAYVFVYNKPHPSYAKLEADYNISANVLYSQFMINSKTASEKYNGKMLLIEGTLSAIEVTDNASIAYFILEEGVFGNQGIRVSMMPEYATALSKEMIEKKIKIKGLCAGFNDTDVILEHGSTVMR